MFSVGQRVWHRNGQRSGTVLECDGDRVFIMQDNGAELDFRASDLTATPPAGANAVGTKWDNSSQAARPAAYAAGAKAVGTKWNNSSQAAKPAAYAVPSRTLTARDITPEHVRVLGIVPARTLQAVAALFESRQAAGKFSALDVAQKLNFIAAVTAVPYRTMQAYSDRPGELGLLMGKGLADSQRNA